MQNKLFRKILKSETDNTLIQLFRYGFVGGGAFIVDFSALFFFTEVLRIYYLLSAAVAFTFGIFVNYYLSVKWVFKYRTYESRRIEFIIFLAIGIIGLALNVFFIWFFTEKVGLFYLLSKLFSTAIVLFWNFFMRKITLFRQEREV